MKRLLLMLGLILLFSGCELQSPFKPSKQEMALEEKALDAKIKQEQDELQAKKEIELAKIDSTVEQEKIKADNLALQTKLQVELEKNRQEQEFKSYLLLLLGFVILLLAFFAFLYFHNRRKDKLKAYEDNLEKYFRNKEHDAKLKITNRILDMVESGKLSSDQETKLIDTVYKSSKKSQKRLEKINKNEEIVDLEVIEEEVTSKPDQK